VASFAPPFVIAGCPEDPSIGVTLPRLRKAEAPMRVPTPEEVGAIMAAAEWWFRPFVALCAFAGLRLGEAAALQANDIDFLRRQIPRESPGAAPRRTRDYAEPAEVWVRASDLRG
jgi:integrase